MLRMQLREQGFDAEEPIVQPYIDEHMVFMREQNELAEIEYDDGGNAYYVDSNGQQKDFEQENLYPPMPGYHLSYFANNAFYVPEAFAIDNIMTNNMWISGTYKTLFKMRYLVLELTYPDLIPFARYMNVGTYLYACKPNVAFGNRDSISAYKEPFAWSSVLYNDYTGYGNKFGTIRWKDRTFHVLQGLGSISGVAEKPGEVELTEGGKSLFDTFKGMYDVGQESSQKIADAFQTIADLFGGSSKKKSKKKKKDSWRFWE